MRIKNAVNYQRATMVLAVVIVILLIGLIIVSVLYSKTSSNKICTTSECIRSAANLKYSIDFSINPCDNFYQFCCGKWSKEHPNHGWNDDGFSTFTMITEKIVIEAMEVLNKDVQEDEPMAVSQAKWFYQSCMDVDTIDSLGLSPLYEYLTVMKLPIVPNFFNKALDNGLFKFDWVKTEALMKVVLAKDTFIGFTVKPIVTNENVIYLTVPDQSSPLSSLFKKRYHNFRKPRSKSHFVRADNDNDDIDDNAENIMDIMKRIFIEHVTVGDSELQEAANIINNIMQHMGDLKANFSVPEGDEVYIVNLTELQDLTNDNIKTPMPDFWLNYVNSLFEDSNVTISPAFDDFYITVTEYQYLWVVLEYVTSQPPLHIELYMWWSAVYAMIINTSEYSPSEVATYSASSSSDESVYVRLRSLDCYELVNKYMGWAVSYAVADKTFANKTKPKVEKMIQDIKNAFIEHVSGIKWMDLATKKVTLEKIKEMISFIGYPDWLFKDGALDKKYQGLEINSKTYLGNMISAVRLQTLETLNSLRIPNATHWSTRTDATDVNAYNFLADNAINVPMAILNYPLYDLGLEVLNYGSIGFILGHELIHGFDNTALISFGSNPIPSFPSDVKVFHFMWMQKGRKHDKYGNHVQWWSNKTIETFENMTQCFIKQYDNFTIEGIDGHVKGKTTLGENLADNGGLNQAYIAYTHYRKKYGEEPKLPGFENYTSNQLFFIAFASSWCETSSMEYLKNLLEDDIHSPSEIRVIGSLQNSEDFAEAFKCPIKSFMNPGKKRCTIW